MLHLHCIFLCVTYYPITCVPFVPGAPCTRHSLDRREHAQFRRIVHVCTRQSQWEGSSVVLMLAQCRKWTARNLTSMNGWFSHHHQLACNVQCMCDTGHRCARGQSSLCVLRDYLPTRSICLQNIIEIACMRSTVLRWAAVRIASSFD